MSDYAAALARRNLDLPAPDGHDQDGDAFWRMSSGELLYAVGDLDALEADALVVLAACAWARSCSRGTRGGA